MRCLIHQPVRDPGKVISFSEKSWKSVTEYAAKWKDLDGQENTIAINFVDVFNGSLHDAATVYGYHMKCYTRFCDKQRVARAEKRLLNKKPVSPLQSSQTEPGTPSPKKRLRSYRPLTSVSSTSSPVLPPVCIVCLKSVLYVKRAGKTVRDTLSKTQTKDIGLLREAATKRRDENILKHIRDKDGVAIEVRYHKKCYTEYTNFLRKQPSDKERKELNKYGDTFDVFSQTVITKRIIQQSEIFCMSKLLAMFKRMVGDIEGKDASEYRSCQLKRLLQFHFPQLIFHRHSKRTKSDLVFVEDTSHLEKIPSSSETSGSESSRSGSGTARSPPVTSQQFDDDSLHCVYTAAMKLKLELNKSVGYEGTWPPLDTDISLEKSKTMIPVLLFNLTAWMIGASDEPSLEDYVEVDADINLKLISILQDILYLHSKGRKCLPKTLALGLTVRHLTGSKKILDILHGLGHCASEKTICRYDTSLAQLQLNQGPVYIPSGFQPSFDMVLVWDNIDFNEETMSGHGTTHHTNGIAVQKASRQTELFRQPELRTSIRKSQTTVLSQTAQSLSIYHPKRRSGPRIIKDVNLETLELAFHKKFHRIQHCTDFAFTVLKYFEFGNLRFSGWTGFNTELTSTEHLVQSNISYLPVIEASPTEMDTVQTILCRSLEMADKMKLKTITVVFDLTIYAKAQEIRWTNEDFFKRIVIRLGEFHTCMSYLSIIGKRFRDAGLQDILIESEIIASGSINAVIEGKQYNRSVNAHKLMFEALSHLKLKAFLNSQSREFQEKIKAFITHMAQEYPSPTFKDLCLSDEFNDILTIFDDFDRQRRRDNPTYEFWSSYLDMVELLLSFIRGTRESNWNLHLSSIRAMLPWYFAYDKTHYSRYLPIYWLEMMNVEHSHPDLTRFFKNSSEWTVQRQKNYGFSSIACDQAIEQTCNRDAKTSGGISGFTLNRNAVRRWILSQNQRASIKHKMEEMAGLSEETRTRKDLDHSRRKTENASIKRLLECIEQMADPFTQTGENLINISSGVVASEGVQKNIQEAYNEGNEALCSFVKERLLSDDIPFHKPIKQLKLKTFSDQLKVKIKTKSGKEFSIQNDRKLFSRLLIISQHRHIDLKEVMRYSLGPVSYPLASSDGSLAKTNKSVLLHMLEEKCEGCLEDVFPQRAALMVDGMATLQSLPKQMPETFGQVAHLVLSTLITYAKENGVKRIDFVCDRYPPISIKNVERSRRAQGKSSQRRHILTKDQKIPQQWSNFLSNGENKEELVNFLAREWANIDPVIIGDICLFITHGELCTKINVVNDNLLVVDVPELKCDHEEADTRLLLHSKHASNDLYSNIVIKTSDTDVGIILISLANAIPSNLYMVTGTKNKFRIINIQSIVNVLGANLSSALIGVHVFSGCDSTSCFHGKGKKKPYELVSKNDQYAHAFAKLGSNILLEEELFDILEQFVCELYSQRDSDINYVRYKLFCLKVSSEHALPPTKDALRQHIMRSNYQCYIHRHSLQNFINIPNPTDHGWIMKNDDLSIRWMTLDPAPEEILTCIHCNCTGTCETKRCSCQAAKLACTELCGCTKCKNIVISAQELGTEYLSDDDDEEDY